jgi:hypothetical protein
MEIFYDANDKLRWRIVREEKDNPKKREIEVSGQCTFDNADQAEEHCCFYLGDHWSVKKAEQQNVIEGGHVRKEDKK